jgi:hypothetical protein
MLEQFIPLLVMLSPTAAVCLLRSRWALVLAHTHRLKIPFPRPPPPIIGCQNSSYTGTSLTAFVMPCEWRTRLSFAIVPRFIYFGGVFRP